MAAAALLEAEVVTADGSARIANAHTNPELFWGLKGGGGGSLGVVTRLTLRTRELPEYFGVARATVPANSDAAFRRLIGRVISFYGEALFNPHWGEQIAFRPNNTLEIFTAFQGLTKEQAETTWRPFFQWVAESPQDYRMAAPTVGAVPARSFWDPAFLRRIPGLVIADDRPGAPAGNVLWAGDVGQVGQFLHGYQSAWMPQALLRPERQSELADAVFAASRHWGFAFHFNKGLAGAPSEDIAAARDTATNPAVLDAFALVICASTSPPAYPGIAGHEPDLSAARAHAAAIDGAMKELRRLAPDAGSYVSESNFFEGDWARSYWGANYPRLRAVKDAFDPEGLFFVHHGVGSERWSADGFTRLG